MFESMFLLPHPEDDGTEANPIFIPDVAVPEFDLFVLQAYGK